MKRFWHKVKNYSHKNPYIVYGWIVVFTTYLVKRFPDLPNELIIMTLLSLFGIGKKIQSIEDNKTLQALEEEPTEENRKKYGKAPRQSFRSTRG